VYAVPIFSLCIVANSNSYKESGEFAEQSRLSREDFLHRGSCIVFGLIHLLQLNVNYLGVTTRVGLFVTIFFEAKRASKKDFHYNP
jgi:hypothetical protein